MPAGLLQPLPLPEWKWDMIAMDFVTGLPHTTGGFDSIWVIIDRLNKSAHFLLVKKTYSTDRLARLYVNRIVCLHGVPVSIVSDRGATFTSIFWQELHKAYVENVCDGLWRTVGHPSAIDRIFI